MKDEMSDEEILKAIEYLDNAPVPTKDRIIKWLDDEGKMRTIPSEDKE